MKTNIKWFLAILFFLLVTAFSDAAQTRQVLLVWDDTNNPPFTVAEWKIYRSTNNVDWSYATNLTFGQWQTNCGGTAWYTNITQAVYVEPGKQYFRCVASNMWAESEPSNTASTPPLPLPPYMLRIYR